MAMIFVLFTEVFRSNIDVDNVTSIDKILTVFKMFGLCLIRILIRFLYLNV